MMDITHLASFYEVVQRAVLRRCRYPGVSKGCWSRHVSALESALNAQLLQRTTRRLSLTEAGKCLTSRPARSSPRPGRAEEGSAP